MLIFVISYKASSSFSQIRRLNFFQSFDLDNMYHVYLRERSIILLLGLLLEGFIGDRSGLCWMTSESGKTSGTENQNILPLGVFNLPTFVRVVMRKCKS